MRSKHLIAVVLLVLSVSAVYVWKGGENAQPGTVTYLIQHLEEFENKKVSVHGIAREVAYYKYARVSIWYPKAENFWLEGVSGDRIRVMCEKVHIPFFENKGTIVEGTVLHYKQEGFYAILADDWYQYFLGVVSVGFYDNVSMEEANTLLETYNLTWETARFFTVWVKVLDGSPHDYLDDLRASDIVSLADSPGENSIFVWFNAGVTQETARELIDSFEDLEVSSIETICKWGVVKVPIGQEQQWVETLENENIVEYAALNSVGWLIF